MHRPLASRRAATAGSVFRSDDTNPKGKPVGRVRAPPTSGRLRDVPSGVSGANGFHEERRGQNPHLGTCALSPRYRGGTGRRTRTRHGARGQPGHCHRGHRRNAARRRRHRRRPRRRAQSGPPFRAQPAGAGRTGSSRCCARSASPSRTTRGQSAFGTSRNISPIFVARVPRCRDSGPHGPRDAEGVADTTSKRLEGVRPASASRLASAAGNRCDIAARPCGVRSMLPGGLPQRASRCRIGYGSPQNDRATRKSGSWIVSWVDPGLSGSGDGCGDLAGDVLTVPVGAVT